MARQRLHGQEPHGFQRYVDTQALLHEMPVVGGSGELGYGMDRFAPVGALETDFPPTATKE